MGLPYVRAHAGDDARRWTTFPHPHVVLAIARTFTSATRLLSALAAFRGDPRIQVVFTFDDTSAFNAGTEALLRDQDVCLLPWDEARKAPARLVLTASENVDLTDFTAPIVVLPHGIGFQKYVPDSLTDRLRISGVIREEFTDWPNVHMVVSHPAQREQLRSEYPHLAASAAVIGDPIHDDLQASVRLRDEYRRRLGVADHHRLVTVTSTWNDQGLLGQRPTLPSELLAQLPHDRYRVAAILHPNIWFAHSPWQVRHWLADALDAGLLLIPPDRGWQAALVGADCVIGDHGSVTLYSAALDRPVLMGTFGEEAVPGTAIAQLAASAPRLEHDHGLLAQVEAAVDGHSPGQHASAAELAFAHVGDSGRRQAEFFYQLLGLPPPPGSGRIRAVPAAEPKRTEVTAFDVHTTLTGPRTVAVDRFPAAVRAPEDPPPGTIRHLAAAVSEPDDALARSASVIYRPGPLPTDRARPWTHSALTENPGVLLTAVGTLEGCLVAIRDGRIVQVSTPAGSPGGPDAPDVCLLASVVYALLRDRRNPSGHFTLCAGTRAWACSLYTFPD
ncbi:CDP-glycerol glycerophosphotransferase family protein [Nocardiopsis rhodophaea]|uniref:CDP-glycerol glycerophosphotransferase family protein n=1 Tax=Nocardiopsis rhodophaea TaxID=280238 RepID=UPI0031E29B63